MKQKYNGSIDELKHVVKSAGILGIWEPDGSGKQIFRTEEGGIINWWPTRTILFQGKPEAIAILERSLKKLLSGKTIKAKPVRTASKSCSEPRSVSRPQITPLAGRYNANDPSLKSIRDALLASGNTIMLINDSPFIVCEADFDHYFSLVERGSEIHIREL